ncbi:S1C family serine protease [Dehalobacterium formicoaceticum]|uniref:Serine protease n=1 Tax=Dehalobacterium formicoaceticum TaxID=51515 RepID=A0ABT1Y5V1_9FIRM|nr:serine protease [Dehalobacterium formicoaceticum]MCR6546257.1 serine protease [Dehalobacterium formicoaceticum]
MDRDFKKEIDPDIDGDLLEENEAEDIEENISNDGSDEYLEVPGRGKWFLRLVGILIILAFTAMQMPNLSSLLSDRMTFLSQNRELLKDEIVLASKPAVVSIEAFRTREADLGISRGTGFNISPSGRIITNHHIVTNADRVTVSFGDGRKYFVQSYEVVPGADVAVIELSADNLPTLPLNKSKLVQRGDTVTIIGNPLGFEKISQRGQVGQFYDWGENNVPIFDIDIPINPGNSGSPVLNNQGEVVGIIFASTSFERNGQKEYRALAIPVQLLELKQS